MLAAVCCYFNPCNFQNLKSNYFEFKRNLQGVDLFTIELSFNGKFEIPDAMHIEGNAKNFMWQKERLLNILVESLPAKYTKIAWIDADIIFQNPNWANDAERLLDEIPVIQLFQKSILLDDKKNFVTAPSMTKLLDLNKSRVGFAWAARRELFPLYDLNIVGGGDTLMYYSWLGRQSQHIVKAMSPAHYAAYQQWHTTASDKAQGKVGYLPDNIIHLWHGDHKNRQYTSRHSILKNYSFNPATDIKIDENGLWCWNSDKPVMHQLIKEYFENRKEDGYREPKVKTISIDVKPAKERTDYSCDVVIPYNEPNYKYLEDSIKSMLNQNFVTTTIHLINDGMSDDPIGEKYSKLNNVRWYKNEISVGPYITFNRLFRYLEHDYFANQDSDDLSLPMRLFKSFEALKKGFDIVGGAMEQFTSFDDESEKMQSACSMKPYHYSGIKRFGSPSGNIVNSTCLMKKSAYEACNGYAAWKAGADSEFFERAIRAGFKAVALSDVVALRRLHNPSLSNDQVTSGHGSEMREEIKRLTVISQNKLEPDHSIGGLDKHRNDKELMRLN